MEEAAEALGVAAEAEAAAGRTGASSRYAAISVSVSAAAAGDIVFCAARPSHMQSLLWHEIFAAEATCFWVVPCATMCSSSRCTSCARSAEMGTPADVAADEVGGGSGSLSRGRLPAAFKVLEVLMLPVTCCCGAAVAPGGSFDELPAVWFEARSGPLSTSTSSSLSSSCA